MFDLGTKLLLFPPKKRVKVLVSSMELSDDDDDDDDEDIVMIKVRVIAVPKTRTHNKKSVSGRRLVFRLESSGGTAKREVLFFLLLPFIEVL